eukprot:GHRQ01033538.1.p1 GENE.GHRQ01033538.1~~GHRQ01033538.1.p1  ORF type:complete len:123 (+),score=8.49 GHRQ01033538.1:466-834(+)
MSVLEPRLSLTPRRLHRCRCSIFNMFDTCLLLSSNGHVVFAGPQRMALAYAAFLGFYIPPGENVADFLMDVIAGGPVAHAVHLREGVTRRPFAILPSCHLVQCLLRGCHGRLRVSVLHLERM